MDEGINSMVETIRELEAENEKLKFRLSNVSGRSELLKSFYQFLDAKGLIEANRDYSDEWVKEYEKTL
jgi:hypothetical protein